MAPATFLSRALGALLRAGAMAVLIALPQLVMGGGSEASRQVVALFALLAAAFTLVEYGARAPSLVEFRDAPPFNRLRALGLCAALLATSLVLRGAPDDGLPALLLRALSERLGGLLDRPFLPVRILMLSLPEGLEAGLAQRARAAAGIAYAVSLGMALAFALALRLRRWPATRRFNVWINLPQFDPTAGGDVVERLQGEGLVNLSLGILMPFVVPVMAGILSTPFDGTLLGDPRALAWLVTAWAFLPASLLMRGLALYRVAAMIAMQRRRAADEEALQPA